MAHPARNADPANILRPSRIFFATTKTSLGRRLLQSDRNANLLIDIIRSLVAERRFKLHDFVIMPDHVHLLIEVVGDMMQLIKGRFSHSLSHEFGYKGEVWQRGFAEVQVMNKDAFETHRTYIAGNPVKAGLVDSPEKYPFCFQSLARKKKEVRRAEAAQGVAALGAHSRG
jgi:REP-associated tyrosine transposase